MDRLGGALGSIAKKTIPFRESVTPSGYNQRALVEAAISRYKRVIGDVLRSHTDGRQATEVAIAVGVLNRMSELGHPESVRIM
jgi:hypothetical protein